MLTRPGEYKKRIRPERGGVLPPVAILIILKGDFIMARSYRWGWQINSLGFLSLTDDKLTQTEIDKRWFVTQFLDPSVREAKCGWYGVAYCVCDINGEDRTEFVLMFGGKDDTPNNARWINVKGDSKGSIAEAVWSLVFC